MGVRIAERKTNMLEAKVYITLKKTVADPQGLTIKHALESLEYKEVKQVRIGKLVILQLDMNDEEEAKKRLDQMCQKLLANSIIEDYTFELAPVN